MANSEATPEVLRQLVARFARARWIKGTNLVTREKIRLVLTEHGTRRLAELFRAFNSLTGEGLPAASQVDATEKLRLILELADVIQELGPPELSKVERDTLIGLALISGEGQAHQCVTPA